MIFVTTGTQLPFPRLIEAMDRLAPDLSEEVVAQVGPDPNTRTHISTHATLAPAAFEQYFREARVVVAHAGIGSILSAKKWHQPLIMVPRRHALGEHRNDHQLATAREIEGRSGFYVAWQTEDLAALLAGPALSAPDAALDHSAEQLLDRVRRFIDN